MLTLSRRPARGLARSFTGLLAAATLLLSACASLNQVSVDVAGFGGWPAARPAGSFVIERLPSQQQRAGDAATAQQVLEDAAVAALQGVGFTRADSVASADVLVQVSARQSKLLDPYADFSLGLGLGFGRSFSRGGMAGLGWRSPFGRGWGSDPVYEQREVGLLLTDRRTREVLYEAHARHGSRVASDAVLKPLFDATLLSFPALATGERRVLIPWGTP